MLKMLCRHQGTTDKTEAVEMIGWRNLREETFAYNIVPVMVMNQQNQVQFPDGIQICNA